MNEKEILQAARAKFGDRDSIKLDVFFEHGQWWLRMDDLEMDISEGEFTYSVVDTSDGIDFEEL